MRSHSGSDANSNNDRDPTLKDNEGRGGTGTRPGDQTEGAPFEVAADKAAPSGQRSPGARGRGDTGASDTGSPVDL